MKKTVRNTIIQAAAVAVMASGVLAEVITHGSHSVEIDFVSVGQPGNSGDSFAAGSPGGVDYEYRIGKFEVTADQWATVAAADARVGSPSASYTGLQPVGGVRWTSAAKFANWLTSGDALVGAYQFNEAGSVLLGTDRSSALTSYDQVYVLPTFNEWYKAAWFNPNVASLAYELFSIDDDGNLVSGELTVGAGGANVDNHMSAPWAVGTGGAELNGTFDMTGNVWEWTEEVAGGSAFIMGGAWGSTVDAVESGQRGPSVNVVGRDPTIGFRMVVIPEPASGLLMVLLGGAGLFVRRLLV